MAVPATGVPEVLEQCRAKGIKNVVVISAGFKEAGREGAVLESKLIRISAMIKSVKAYRILKGVRKEPMSDIDSLLDVLLRVSQLSMDFPEIREADLNPIKVFEHGKGCYAIDFKMITGERK